MVTSIPERGFGQDPTSVRSGPEGGPRRAFASPSLFWLQGEDLDVQGAREVLLGL